MTPTDFRLAMRRNGFDPIPVAGKIPPLEQWQRKLAPGEADIRYWATVLPWADNTGANAQRTPGLDIDILDAAAAEAVEQLAREYFEEHGDILVRIGRAPKRLIPLRTDEPFKKLRRDFVAPNGMHHAIEMLGDGEQWVAYGTHPGTGLPYRWHGGELTSTRRDALPYIRLADAQRFMDDAAKLLAEDFSYTLANGAGNGAVHEPGEPQAAINRIAAALDVIPNNEDWDGWNKIGMSAWRASGGSPEGFAAFESWSAKSPKHDPDATRAKWEAYFRSPPTKIGAGTIFYRAEQESPGWWRQPQPDIGPEPPPSEPEPEPKPPPLPWIDMSAWDDEPVPDQEWTVRNIIPARQVTLFSGHGAAGKSTLGLYLAAAHAVAGPWLHSLPEPGPAWFIDAEDDEAVIHRRLSYIARHFNVKFADLINNGLRILPLAGEDAMMATTNRSGVVEPTRLYHRLFEEASDVKPKQIVVAAAANVFGGSEINRAEVTKFVGLMTRVTIRTGGSLVLISHPSLTGMANESGISGSTHWHNAVRARLYLKNVKAADGEQPDNDLRVLEFMKNQYGALASAITLRFRDGMFLPKGGTSAPERAAQEAAAEAVFLKLLRVHIDRHIGVGPNPTARNYAPTVFAKLEEAKVAGVTKTELAAAMDRLVANETIKLERHGSDSKARWYFSIA